MKQIVYYVVDNGVEGNEKDVILYASFDEPTLDSMLASDRAKSWRKKKEMIVETESAKAEAMSKLNGIDRLVLSLPSWIDELNEKRYNVKL